MRKILLLCLTFILPFASAGAAGKTILVFGDSLSAGYGLAREQAWPVLLQTRLKETGQPYTVVNASITGETTAGGRSRLGATLKQHKPDIVVIELGANDGLRGLPISAMRDNLAAMISASKKAGAKVLLVGMRIPPNYGIDYTRQFAASFGELARQHKTALVPFLLEKLIGRNDAFLPDNLHPAAVSQPMLLDTVWPELKPLLG